MSGKSASNTKRGSPTAKISVTSLQNFFKKAIIAVLQQ